MDLLTILARAFDTKGYPDDKDPNHWKTINGAHVHTDKNGNYDGGAGGKFTGKHHWGPGYKEKGESATSIASILAGLTAKKTPPPKIKVAPPAVEKPPDPPPKPTITETDLRKAWAKVVKYQVAMKQSKKATTWEKHAEHLKEAISDYEKMRNDAPADVARTHSPKIESMKTFAATPYGSWKSSTKEAPATEEMSPLARFSKATETGTPEHPFSIWGWGKRKSAKVADTPKAADKMLRKGLTKVWAESTPAERNAAFVYSYSFKQFQEPLRGVIYGKGKSVSLESMPWDTLGVGRMGKKKGEVKGYIKNLTSIIDRSSYDEDVTLVRGNGYDGVAALFGVSAGTLRTSSETQLERLLVGKQGKDEGFTSCGSSAGGGFADKDVIMHVACPAGTKMLYMEPFAAYGGDSPYSEADLARMYSRKEPPKSYWDGKTEQKKYGKQDETILQRGTTFQATGVKREGGKLHIYVQVVSQEPYKIT